MKNLIEEILACPRCKGGLSDFHCEACGISFPHVENIPILINEENSLFKFSDFAESKETTYKANSTSKKLLKSLIPSINMNIGAAGRYENFFSLLPVGARVLVIGGAVEGKGFDPMKIGRGITLIESDVAFGERTNLICDAHDLPFKAGTIDGVVAQAVLEHVVDPWACVSEIERVLKKDGLVYAETPFIQQVHAGRYDFTRFTHLGHRRLFRHFAEIESGASCGSGMALAWSWCYFLQSFFSNKAMGKIAFAFGSLTSFWLKYFDYFLAKKPGAFDSASSYYFIGKKAEDLLSDKELIKAYQGLNG